MQNAALAAAGLTDWRYLALPLPPELLAETVRALPAAGFRGVNVTIPHKEAALALATTASEAAREIGAANTLTFEPGGAIAADNTDAPGLLAALGERCDPAGRTALVLGAGRRRPGRRVGAAAGRSGRRGGLESHPRSAPAALVAALGGRVVELPSTAQIVVNCTSVGLAEPEATFKALPLQADSLGAGSCVVDMVYRDGGTRLLEAARTRGADVIDGLEILIAQGAASFERWTGRTAPRQAMREAVRTIAST